MFHSRKRMVYAATLLHAEVDLPWNKTSPCIRYIGMGVRYEHDGVQCCVVSLYAHPSQERRQKTRYKWRADIYKRDVLKSMRGRTTVHCLQSSDGIAGR